MINIYVCLLETAWSLKFNARFNPTVFRIALLSLLLCAIYTRYITIKFNAPRLSPPAGPSNSRFERLHIPVDVCMRVRTEALRSRCEERKREQTTGEKLIRIFNATWLAFKTLRKVFFRVFCISDKTL